MCNIFQNTGTDAERRLCRMAPGTAPSASPKPAPGATPSPAPKTPDQRAEEERRITQEETEKAKKQFMETVSAQNRELGGKIDAFVLSPDATKKLKERADELAKKVQKDGMNDMKALQEYERFVRGTEQYAEAKDDWSVLSTTGTMEGDAFCLYRRLMIGGNPCIVRYTPKSATPLYVVNLVTGDVKEYAKPADAGITEDIGIDPSGAMATYDAKVNASLLPLDAAAKERMKKQFASNRGFEDKVLNNNKFGAADFRKDAEYWKEQNEAPRERFDFAAKHSLNAQIRSAIDALRGRPTLPGRPSQEVLALYGDYMMRGGSFVPETMEKPLEWKRQEWRNVVAPLVLSNPKLVQDYRVLIGQYEIGGSAVNFGLTQSVHIETWDLLLGKGKKDRQYVLNITPTVFAETVEWFEELIAAGLNVGVATGPGGGPERGSGRKPEELPVGGEWREGKEFSELDEEGRKWKYRKFNDTRVYRLQGDALGDPKVQVKHGDLWEEADKDFSIDKSTHQEASLAFRRMLASGKELAPVMLPYKEGKEDKSYRFTVDTKARRFTCLTGNGLKAWEWDRSKQIWNVTENYDGVTDAKWVGPTDKMDKGWEYRKLADEKVYRRQGSGIDTKVEVRTEDGEWKDASASMDVAGEYEVGGKKCNIAQQFKETLAKDGIGAGKWVRVDSPPDGVEFNIESLKPVVFKAKKEKQSWTYNKEEKKWK